MLVARRLENYAADGIKDRESNKVRAKVIENTTVRTLQGFINENVSEDATVYIDDSTAYSNLLFDRESVRHSVGEYVTQQAHINGIESFWATLRRAHKDTLHIISPTHIDRYVQQFASKHRIRNLDTLAQMLGTVARLVGRNLLHRRLTADN